MGYRSDVVYVFYIIDPASVPFSLIKLWFDENYPKHDFGTVETGEDYIKVSYVSVKWYQGYPEVQAVENAVDLFGETFKVNEHPHVAWEMVRVGEENADITHDGSGYMAYRLGVNREICFD